MNLVPLVLGLVFGTSLASQQKHRSSSVLQVRETLQNLAKSTEDEGRDAENLFKSKQVWCASALKEHGAFVQVESDSLEQLTADLKEHEAAVDEATGTVSQIKAEMALTQHVMNRTEDVLRSRRMEEDADSEMMNQAKQDLQNRPSSENGKSFLQAEAAQLNSTLLARRAAERAQFQADESDLLALMDNKGQSLASMQAELETEYLLLAQMQELTAQTRQELSDRGESLQHCIDFVNFAKDDCKAAEQRADTQAASRVGVANAINEALQHLEVPSAPKAEDTGSVPLSFAQWRSQITAADVLSMIPRSRGSRSMLEMVQMYPGGSAPSVFDAKPKVSQLLTSLKTEHGSEQEHQQWCTQEGKKNALTLRLKQDSVDQLDAEISAHTEAEAQLDADLQNIDVQSTSLSKAATAIEELAKKEKLFMESTGKDHQLASRILDQAITILSNVEAQETADSPVKGAGEAADSLKKARTTFATENQAAASMMQQAAESSERMAQAAKDAMESQKRERVNIEIAKDGHTQKRAQCEDNKRILMSEVSEAQSFVQQLKQECGSALDAEEEKSRQEQIQALEDAERSLDGQAIGSPASDSDSDVPSEIPEDTNAVKNMSPMERAAMEMGVSAN